MIDTLRVVVIGDDLMKNALVGTAQGGKHLASGLVDTVAETFAGSTVDLIFFDSGGIGTLRKSLNDPSSKDVLDQIENRCDIVILAMTDDVRRLPETSADPYEAMDALSEDLISVIDTVKRRTGAHVLIANAATFDPMLRASSLFGIDPEPLSLRAHRVDLVLLNISHLLGVSIINLDRITAEAGAGKVIPEALALTQEGSALFRDETVRILGDYGFFDDRPLAPQVGNREASR
jgi:hypothetical protein